jgi:hypothetical protein
MISELGYEGYAFYWMLIEKLAEANGKLLLEDINGLAFAWKVDKSKLILLRSKYNLFKNDKKFFWSPRLLVSLEKRGRLSKTRSKAGRIGGLAKAKQKLSKSQPIANILKKRKEKESKVIINTMQTESANEVNKLLKEFQDINPTINYGNKTQRSCCENLIKKFGYEKVLSTLNYYKSVRAEKYCPSISTPYELEQKMGGLLNFYHKSIKKSKITIL